MSALFKCLVTLQSMVVLLLIFVMETYDCMITYYVRIPCTQKTVLNTSNRITKICIAKHVCCNKIIYIDRMIYPVLISTKRFKDPDCKIPFTTLPMSVTAHMEVMYM